MDKSEFSLLCLVRSKRIYWMCQMCPNWEICKIKGSVGMLRGFPRWLSGKESARQCRRHQRCRFEPWLRRIPWRRKWQPTPIFLPGKSHAQRSLVGFSPWGHQDSDMTELRYNNKQTINKNSMKCLCAPLWITFRQWNESMEIHPFSNPNQSLHLHKSLHLQDGCPGLQISTSGAKLSIKTGLRQSETR